MITPTTQRFMAVAALLFAVTMVSGCSGGNRSHAVYLLIDTSGTYAQEVEKAHAVVNYLLGNLQPGDALAVAKVESRSFSEKDIIAKATFDRRPSQANSQKRAFQARMAAFMQTVRGSAHTDITGGLIQAAEYLNETGARYKTVLIFSDMQEELDKATVRDFSISLKNIRVIAVNVTKLHTDNIDPRRYLGRLEQWQRRVIAAGATEWRVINDLEQLDRLLSS